MFSNLQASPGVTNYTMETQSILRRVLCMSFVTSLYENFDR